MNTRYFVLGTSVLLFFSTLGTFSLALYLHLVVSGFST